MAFEVGQIVEGKVTGIMNYGAFVDLGDGVSGMVHISEVAATYVTEIKDHLTIGQQVKVKVLSTDENGRISLSIKKALPRPQNNNQNGNRPRNNAGGNRGGYKPRGGNSSGRPDNFDWTKKNNSSNNFDEMLSSFLASSDEKMAGMKKKQSDGGSSRPRSRKGNNNNNGGSDW